MGVSLMHTSTYLAHASAPTCDPRSTMNMNRHAPNHLVLLLPAAQHDGRLGYTCARLLGAHQHAHALLPVGASVAHDRLQRWHCLYVVRKHVQACAAATRAEVSQSSTLWPKSCCQLHVGCDGGYSSVSTFRAWCAVQLDLQGIIYSPHCTTIKRTQHALLTRLEHLAQARINNPTCIDEEANSITTAKVATPGGPWMERT